MVKSLNSTVNHLHCRSFFTVLEDTAFFGILLNFLYPVPSVTNFIIFMRGKSSLVLKMEIHPEYSLRGGGEVLENQWLPEVDNLCPSWHNLSKQGGLFIWRIKRHASFTAQIF
jgi:hypothetical protein